MPSGITSTPNITTIQGIVRHRLRPPMKPDSASSMYATAPSPASEMGHALETSDSSTRRVPSPKNGSQGYATWPSCGSARRAFDPARPTPRAMPRDMVSHP